MKFVAIWREACRNIVTGTSRVVLFSLIVAAFSGAFLAADLLSIRSLTDAAEHYQSAGASISILEAPGRIDGVACEALQHVPGIRSAGAMRAEEKRLTLSVLPGAPVPTSTVTGGFAALLGARIDPGTGVYLSDQVAEVLGVSVGDEVSTEDGAVRIVGIYSYPSDGRVAGYGYMALIPSNDTAPFDSCWADIWPQSDQRQSLLYTSLLSSPDEETNARVQVRQLNSTLGTTFDGYSTFSSRMTRYAPVVIGLIAAMLGYISIWLRRLEIASNLHAGVSRGDQRSILTIETAVWVLLGLLFSEVVAVILIAADTNSDRGTLILIANRSVLVAGAGAFLGAVAAWLLTREKHLFAYFKNR